MEGATDPYGASTPSCWAAYGSILERDFGAWSPATHRRTADAYLAQHPSFRTAAGKRSVVVHLVGLHASLELGLEPHVIGRVLGRIFPDKTVAPPELSPLPSLSGPNVGDVLEGPESEHDERVLTWARFVWHAWEPHHARVRTIAQRALSSRGSS